jgi:hypothetical protein
VGDALEAVDGERPCADDGRGTEEEVESGYRKGGISIDCKEVRLLGILLTRWVCDR